MRVSPSSTEQLLWHCIRGRRLGVVLRRQVPLLGRFIADFLAPAQRLVIEVDGAYHGKRGALTHAVMLRSVAPDIASCGTSFGWSRKPFWSRAR
jgi:very-short-patch-repair endonuclease